MIQKKIQVEVSDCSDRGDTESECPRDRYVKYKKTKTKRESGLPNGKGFQIKSRKYTVDGSDNSESSSGISCVDFPLLMNNVYLEDFYAMRKKGVSASDAGWSVLIALESEKLMLQKKRDKREQIKASRPWPYGMDGVQKVDDFLDDFERYAKEQFGSDKNRWAVELRNFLDGQARRVYFSVYKPGVRYDTIVSRVKNWCNEERHDRKVVAQREFWTAGMKSGEKLSEYALRLQTLYESAVPKDERDKQALKEQFMCTIPPEIARRFRVRMGRDVEGKKIKWREIVSWALEDDAVGDVLVRSQEEPPLPVWAFTQDVYDVPRTYSNVTEQGRPSGSSRQMGFSYGIKNTEKRINVECKYCKKRNHLMKDCWKMKGLCLLCGNEGHRVSMCEKRRVGTSKGLRKMTEKVVKCYGCNDPGHIAVNCPIIVRNKQRNNLITSEQINTEQNITSNVGLAHPSQASNLN